MEENTYERVAKPDDPDRCQSVTAHGQCHLKAIKDTPYCILHGANTIVKEERKQQIRSYRLQLWQQRLNELSDHPEIKSLRDEIGILRMTLEPILNACKDANDFLMHSGKIADLVVKIEKLVSSCHRLEAASGQLIDKTTALNFAQQLVEIVSRHVEDSDSLDAISGEVFMAVGSLTGSKKAE